MGLAISVTLAESSILTFGTLFIVIVSLVCTYLVIIMTLASTVYIGSKFDLDIK